eukprot:SAG11_NODE_3414_length_2462_cov_11.817605_1_plen_421_part_10
MKRPLDETHHKISQDMPQKKRNSGWPLESQCIDCGKWELAHRCQQNQGRIRSRCSSCHMRNSQSNAVGTANGKPQQDKGQLHALARQNAVPNDSTENDSPTAVQHAAKLTQARKEQITIALRNYECYHRLPAGSATINQLEQSPAGTNGWYLYKSRKARKQKPKQRHERELLAHMCHVVRPDSMLMAASKATKEKYKTRTQTDAEVANNTKHAINFERELPDKLDESLVNKTHPQHKSWVDAILANKDNKYKCLTTMEKFEPLPHDKPLVVEDKEGVTGPPPNRYYKTPHGLLPQLHLFISEMLKKGYIQPSTSEYCSPVVIIKKPNGNGYRFVVDLRQLNARTKPFQYHLPEPEDCVDKLKGAKWLSVIDIEKAFWNLALHKNSRHKTAFKCVFGTFEYCVAPMGLLTSAAWWQRFIEQK